MPRFEIEDSGRRYEVEAPNLDAATAAFRTFSKKGRAPSSVTDVLQSFPRGVAKGAIGTLTGLGAAGQEDIGPSRPEMTKARDMPSTQDVTKRLGFSKPQTTAGEWAETVGEPFGNPANYFGPGGPVRAMVSGVGGAIGSKLGSDLTGGSIWGSLFGGAIGGLSGGTRNSTPEPLPPSAKQIFEAADNAYDTASKLNIKVPIEESMNVADAIKNKLNENGLYRDNPQLSGVFNQVERLGARALNADHVSSNELFAIQKSLNGLARRNPRTEISFGAQMAREELLDYMQKFPQLKTAIQVGNANYRVGKMSEAVTTAKQKGEFAAASSGKGDNIDNALRQKIKSLYLDKKVYKTAEEKKIMEEIINGDNSRISKVNIARRFKGLTGPLKWLATGVTGGLLHGHSSNIFVGAVQLFAQSVAERHTFGKIDKLDEMIRRGAPIAGPRQPASPSSVGLQRGINTARGLQQGLYEN